jgi:acetyl-CoA synthetase
VSDALTRTNVGRWAGELGFTTYAELHTYSVTQPETFLTAALDKLHIRFRRPSTRVLDLSDGVEHPVWLRGAVFNITESVFQAAPDSPAIVSRREDVSDLRILTVAELDALSGRVANGLRGMGFGVGDAIAIDMPMTPECVAIYLGIIRAGMAVVSIADSFAPEEIAARLEIANTRAVLTQDLIPRGGKRLPLYQRVVDATRLPVIVVETGLNDSVELRNGDTAFRDFIDVEAECANHAAMPGDTINILFSSGTTGEPKAIPWNHSTPIRSALDGYVHMDLQPGDTIAWPTNVGWMMGPWLIFAALINRSTIALWEGMPQTREFGQFVADAGVTQLGVVPSLVRTWRSTDCMRELDWTRIRNLGSTGEASNADDMQWLMAFAGDKPVIEYCGGTETGGSYITSTLLEPNRPACFSAKTIASDFVILDESGAEADTGEVFLVPPVLGHSTRLLNADHHRVYFEGCPRGPDGQILRRHGDQVERLADGYYRALGRSDDTMNLGGIKISSLELERAMNALEGVMETAAIAVTPEGGGPSELVVYAVLEPGTRIDSRVLQTRLQEQISRELNPLFRIGDVRTIDALPRTASNKVMRRRLRERYRSG